MRNSSSNWISENTIGAASQMAALQDEDASMPTKQRGHLKLRREIREWRNRTRSRH